MNRTIAPLAALLVLGAMVSAGCGGNVIVDGAASNATASSAAASSSSGAGAGGSTGSGGASTGAGGCDPATHTIAISEFDVSCTVASDCIGVYIGDFCNACRCPFWAINVDDMMKYDAEAQAKEAGTPPGGCNCPAAPVICNQGQCATQMP